MMSCVTRALAGNNNNLFEFIILKSVILNNDLKIYHLKNKNLKTQLSVW
jgi:hypothetical protein